MADTGHDETIRKKQEIATVSFGGSIIAVKDSVSATFVMKKQVYSDIIRRTRNCQKETHHASRIR